MSARRKKTRLGSFRNGGYTAEIALQIKEEQGGPELDGTPPANSATGGTNTRAANAGPGDRK